MRSILITGSGCPGWYSVYQQIHGLEIFGCDILLNTVGNRLAKKQYQVPTGGDPSYLNEITKIVKLNEIDLVLPLTDPELIPLSTSSLPVMVSATAELEKMLDKGKLYKGLSQIAPRFIHAKSKREVIDFMEDSCFIKMITAHGSRGTKKLVSTAKWLEGFSTLKPEAFGMTFPVDYLDSLDVSLLAIETLPGAEYSIDCVFNRSSDLCFYGVREREVIRNGICHTAKLIGDKDMEFRDFIGQVESFVKMKWNINIQAKRDKSGNLKLLEINPRISGSLGSFGTNLVKMGLDLFTGKLITPAPVVQATRSYRVSFFVQGER